MKYLELQEQIEKNIFIFSDVEKHFPEESGQTLRVQLFRFVKRGVLSQLKRGVYFYTGEEMEEFELANILYKPSYISLESALNYYGLIPDIPQAVTSVNPTTSKKLTTEFGRFYYSKIKQELFWGFTKIDLPKAEGLVNFAEKEKGLLDYFYLRKTKNTAELRLDLQQLDEKKYKRYAAEFPGWVQKISLFN